ncbi:AAA family ATPase [uncultured Desulfobacter sp.]|uniref:AAA family ATPase n=1 Tax=uncultured Desulfobacter sp. TaxID=240139 RepID=UPI002AA6A6D9|nr:AAA family ATPase [uncultured Desulfobacter sp.]
MAENNNISKAEKRPLSLKNLYLDPNNYRLIHEPEYVEVGDENIKDKSVQRRTYRLLTGDKYQHIQDLVESFKSNGYLPVDQIQIRPIDDGAYVVVEGNRRIATLKYLQQEYDSKDIDLGALDSSIFSAVPVVRYTDSNEMHHLTLMALKHISGNKKWGEWNQAKLLEKMHTEYKISEDNICKRIGISKVELRRSLRALSFLQQYIDSDYGDQFSEGKFPIFREVARNAAIKEWIGWDDSTYKAMKTSNMELFFSLISREPLEDEGDDGAVEYGNGYHEPALIKRDDIRLFGKILDDPKAMTQLQQTRDINAAYRSSDQIFKERQQAAISAVNNEIATISQMVIQPQYLPELENALGRLKGAIDKTKASGLAGVEQTTAFHDRIDGHFTTLNVHNYKRLQGVNLVKISRLNLIAGLNNSGKTTLLEAIYLLCRQNDFSGLMEVIRRRGKVAVDKINPEWFIEQLPAEISISGCFDGNKAEVAFRHYKEEDREIDVSRYLESVEITSGFGEKRQESITRIFQGRERETIASGKYILCPSIFSSPFFLNEPHRYTAFYHKSTQSKALPKIFEFIRQSVVDTVEDIRLVDELQRFLVTDQSYEYALDLTEYGEGMQRIFFISLLFASAQNGVVLIDEFENAIHSEIIEKFVIFIDELARLFNVQVFLTTHSKECIDAFLSKVSDLTEVTACALVDDKESIRVREFTGRELKTLVDAGDVDLRRAM